MIDEQHGSRKALADGQIKKTRRDHVGKLDVLRSSFKTLESKLLQKRKERMVEWKQLRTERDVKASWCRYVL